MRISAFILLFLLTSSLSAAFGPGTEAGKTAFVCDTQSASLKDSDASYECSGDFGEAVQTTASATASARALRKLQESRLRNSNELPDGHSALCFPTEQNHHAKHPVAVLSGIRVSELVCICPKFAVLRI